MLKIVFETPHKGIEVIRKNFTRTIIIHLYLIPQKIQMQKLTTAPVRITGLNIKSHNKLPLLLLLVQKEERYNAYF